ncbi:hypothetical protein [Streptomyces sp. SHP 1-2]|uniref:hypothetical protein n=1 Tax=Streptomyces sp. SHP 1-2 TaxID=2769489 RepID=UPI0022373C84|nr:hypothetical protein [Streptomyces sp. SHP 1-2]MCW5254106.1 hypothetical protein [Streptomyces sp. SHP 1-2]
MHSDHVTEWLSLYDTGPVNGRLQDSRDRIVLGFRAPTAATWVADASRIDDALARRP